MKGPNAETEPVEEASSSPDNEELPPYLREDPPEGESAQPVAQHIHPPNTSTHTPSLPDPPSASTHRQSTFMYFLRKVKMPQIKSKSNQIKMYSYSAFHKQL
ncbi:uncharacterized protein LOC118215787 isoform X3 [Anguilla anguilla]|uniref:uncharacterized protein LOC118215787 isoform X3 n=1 Tax=Anguilla anguilla TaxID=7936 RepID=UPI0015AC22B0|nr:uncharacterized protein LOC118215787 isoform X3 [Anguilla anguilla]